MSAAPSEIRLTQTGMNEALDYYLNQEVIKAEVDVTDVSYVTGTGLQPCFVVKLKPTGDEEGT